MICDRISSYDIFLFNGNMCITVRNPGNLCEVKVVVTNIYGREKEQLEKNMTQCTSISNFSQEKVMRRIIPKLLEGSTAKINFTDWTVL